MLMQLPDSQLLCNRNFLSLWLNQQPFLWFR
jgi:hypothetical protein